MTQSEIRRALLTLGFDPDSVGLDKAVRLFQASRFGLAVDGKPGPKTQAALSAALAARVPFSLAGALTVANLRKVAPFARADVLAAIVAARIELEAADIVTKNRLHHFIAHAAHETAGFARLEENLRYSAARLVQVWPSRFPTLAAAQPYALNPEKLANKVYGGRLGNVEAGDGWRYRGSGAFCTTGRANYREAGHEADPEALRDPAKAVSSAVLYWRRRGLNAAAERDDIEATTRGINGGLIGLDDRRAYLAACRKYLV